MEHMKERLEADTPCVVDTRRVAAGIASVIIHHDALFELPPVTAAQYDRVCDLFLEPAILVKEREPVTV